MNTRTRELLQEAIMLMHEIDAPGALLVVETDNELLTLREGQVVTFHQDDRLNLILSEHPDSPWNLSTGNVVVHTDAGHFIIAPDGEYTLVTHDGIAVTVPFEI